MGELSDPPASTPPDASEKSQRLLARYGRRFGAGEVLFNDGEPAEEAFLLQEGRVRLLKRVGALERSLRVLGPGDLFGEGALVPGTPRNTTAVALEDGVALVLDQDTLEHVLLNNPAVGRRVLEQLLRRLRDAEDQIEVLMVRDTQTKVAIALLKLAQQSQMSSVASSATVHLDVSPLDLSSRVGLDVDTVKRAVLALRASGYVQIVEEKLRIEDVTALTELVGLLGVKDEILGAEPPSGAEGRRTTGRQGQSPANSAR